ncbi:MAG: hypothetical protein H8F28_10415, partial [Fibrella sp.]|nr:hypothetical protein [Armatimonadota bacterium]
ATGVTNFMSLNNGLQMTQFYFNAYHPTNPNFMIGGAQDNGVAGTFGDLNDWEMIQGGDGTGVAINPLNPNTIYFSSQNGSVNRSDDAYGSGNAGVSDISPDNTAAGTGRIAFVTPMALDPTNPNFLYVPGQKLGRYNATTGTWTYFPTVLTSEQSSNIAISPISGQRIFVATLDGKLWTTGNGGTTFLLLKEGVEGEALPNRVVATILPDPANANAVFVGLSGTGTSHIYYCANVTAPTPVWTSLNGAGATALPDAPLNAIAVDPADANILYVGTDVGVFQSPDRGLTWTNATETLGLPNVQVNDLKAMPLQGFLYAGTFGRGIYRIRIRNNDPVSGLLFNPEKIIGGGVITGTVLLGTDAPVGGKTVSLTSGTPSAATVPTTVTVPAGQNQATFPITTIKVGFTTPVTITASVGAATVESKSGSITVLSGGVLPTLQSFTYVDFGTSIDAPIGFGGPIQAKITLSKAATAPISIPLTSTDSSVVVPATVTVPTGATTVLFDVTFKTTSNPVSGKVNAKLGNFQKSITFVRSDD